ncbi:MAG: hypothetical protein ACREF4_18440, partial [Gammaproteobacteria bacterium]
MTVDVDIPAAEPLVTIADVEILRAGTWDLSTGPVTFTIADLAAAASAPVDCPAIRNPVLKLGHDEPRTGELRWDGEPAVGWVSNLRIADGGATLVGDYTGVPAWLADVIASAYPDRSAESEHGHLCQVGHRHPFVVHAVSLLSVTRPGIGNLNSLQDVAALYGVPSSAAAAGEEGSVPQVQINAAVSSEDVRRRYFESGAPWSVWITEVQLDPPQLIVTDDAGGKMYRVPFTISGDEITFGQQQEVAIEYVDKASVAAAVAAHRRLQFASRDEGRPASMLLAAAIGSHSTATDTGAWDAGANEKNLSTDAGSATYRKMYAYVDSDGDPDTKAAYKFPHHFVGTDGTVGAASTKACSSGIGVLNGGRGGADIPDDAKQGVYNHLAKHLRDADLEPPELAAAGDGHHQEGSGQVPNLTDEQVASLRAAAGLPETETDLGKIFAAVQAKLGPAPPAPAGDAPPQPTPELIAAGAKPGSGVVVIDASQWEEVQQSRTRFEKLNGKLQARERDDVIEAAVRAGKFPPARREHWAAAWDKDPDGT